MPRNVHIPTDTHMSTGKHTDMHTNYQNTVTYTQTRAHSDPLTRTHTLPDTLTLTRARPHIIRSYAHPLEAGGTK